MLEWATVSCTNVDLIHIRNPQWGWKSENFYLKIPTDVHSQISLKT